MKIEEKLHRKTHQVLDLHYTEDECNSCFVGSRAECEEFAKDQTPHFMYKIVPLTEAQFKAYNS